MADITEIDGKKYEYKFTLRTVDGEIELTHAAIKALDIVENIFEPFTDATVVIANPYNYIDGRISIRGDGTDVFYVYLKPTDVIGRNPFEYTLDYTFSIIDDINVVDDASNLNTFKILKLRDQNATKLGLKMPYGKRYRGKAGNILQQVLSEGLEDESIVNVTKFEPGNFEFDKFPEWFIPPNSFRYMDVVKYLLRYYYYLDKDTPIKALLKYNRHLTKPKYELLPLTRDYFTKNKELVSESFDVGTLPSTSEFESEANSPSNPPLTESKRYFQYINTLTSLNITTPMVEYSNSYFMNAQVTGYDHKTGVFHSRQLFVNDLKEKWQKLYVDVFKSIGGQVKPWLNLNKQKNEQFKVYSLPFHIDDNKNIVEAEIINAFNFFNLQLTFTIPGATSRDSGNFIDIIKRTSKRTTIENKYDQKLLGRWFVTTMRHSFQGNTYKNEFQCIKTYAGPQSVNNDNV